jgi:luciferase family oxidoreductase group 1
MLDFAQVRSGQTTAESLASSVLVAQTAERFGYRRVWFAEHHNNPGVASSATSIVISHIASQTTTIRVGSGGIMLPNHSPLIVAEQFGTLDTLYPGRIDLGLGRAPGTDLPAVRAMRRSASASEHFADDILELRAYLSDTSIVDGVQAIPGRGTHVPLYILGSSMFGARLAAHLGLPYAFASHFAPDYLQHAVAVYREEFTPSSQLDAPYVMAGLNVIVADDRASAEQQFHESLRDRVRSGVGRDRLITDDEADGILASPAGWQLREMARYSAVGTPTEVNDVVESFSKHADADEIVVVVPAPSTDARLRSVELLAEVVNS